MEMFGVRKLDLWLPYGADFVVIHVVVLIQYRRVSDRQTDRQTHDDSKYRASIASRGKN